MNAKYLQEKQSGKRLENGALKLKRLKPKHLAVIRAHLAGEPSTNIAHAAGMTDATISRILNDPLAQEVIAEARRTRAEEFEALEGMHLEALRNGFRSGDVRDQIRTAAVYSRERTERRRAEGSATAESAEDVIERMLQLNLQVNVEAPK